MQKCLWFHMGLRPDLLCCAGIVVLAVGCGGSDKGGAAASPPLSPPRPPPRTLGAGFVDLTPTALRVGVFPRPSGASERRLITGGLFADLDEDGRSEVVFVHRDPTPGGPGVPVVYRYDGRALAPAADLPLPPELFVAALVDVDGDGHVDAVGTRPDPLRPGQSLAKSSGRVVVAFGLGGGRFEAPMVIPSPTDVTDVYLLESVALADVDADGWLDLVLGDNACGSRCRALHPVLRTGPRAYADRADLVDAGLRGGAYAVVAAPLAGRAMMLGAIGSLCENSTHAFFRPEGADADGYPRFAGYDPTPQDAAYRARNSGRSCPSIACSAPMSAAWSDLDDDGLLDMLVEFDPTHSVFAGTASGPWRDLTASLPFRLQQGPARPMLSWGSALLDVDQDGRDDVVMTHGDDQSSAYDPGHAIGPQHTTVFWNATGMRFADITALTHLDAPGQWRALTAGDLEGDGDPDLIVGGFGDPPKLFRNDVAAGNHQLALRLRGTTSNHLGVGARVAAYLPGGAAPVTRVAGSFASPVTLSEPLVFVGVGALERAPRVTVTWPSGLVQELADLAAGRVTTITEPALFAVEPASRHVRAGAEATVRVTPRAPDGSPRVTDRVAVRSSRADATVELARTAEGWVARVRAPSPGSVVLTVEIDGAAVEVRPRIWFDPA